MQARGWGRSGWTLAAGAVVLAALLLRWRWFAPYDIAYPDELMQYLEQGRRLATGHGIVPWEYRYGARNAPVAQLLAMPWWLGERIASGTSLAMLLARGWFVALNLAVLPAAWRLGRLTSPAHALIALLVAGLWWEAAMFGNLLLSEALSAALVLAGAALLLDESRGKTRLRWAGLLLGLAVVVRFQHAPAVAVLALLALKRDWRTWRELVLGGLCAMAIGAVSDLAMGRTPYAWILINLQFNSAEGRAERFGANGPFDYLLWLWRHLGPATPLIVGAALYVPARYRPLLIALAVNLAFHSVVTHKEYRFVWLTTLGLLVLAAIGSVSLLERLLARRGRSLGAAQLVLLALAWLCASLAAEVSSGGARAFRGGGPIPLAALDGVRTGQACGIALPDQWRAHLVPALLPRPVPLYVAAPDVQAGGKALPAELTGAANLLVFPSRPRGAEQYRLLSCRENGAIRACLFERSGPCAASAVWSYQGALEREDL